MTGTKSAARRWRKAAAQSLVIAVAVSGLTWLTFSAAQAADPIDGPQTAGDEMFPNVGNGGYDAQHYDVDVAWQPTGVVDDVMTGEFTSATTKMVARTTGAPLKTFSLDFEGLEVDEVTVNGKPATYERVQDADAIKFKLIVTPATPVEGSFTTKVRYHGVPQTHVDPDGSWEGWAPTSDGATFLGQPVGAMAGYPHNNAPADKATYTFGIDIPTTLTNAAGTGAAAAASNGELVSRTGSPDGQRTTWVWVQDEPMASELALISIGKYDVIRADVTLSDGRTIPEWTFMDSALSQENKTTITNRRAQLSVILSRLEQIYGPYPGNSAGVVVDTVPSGVDYALETQDRPFFPSTNSVNGGTLIHELVHQWYGDNVSPGLWTDIWVNEGMASWGPTYYNNVLAADAPNPGAVETAYFNSWNTRAPTNPEWATPPGSQTDPAELYGFQTYTRGAMFWEALRTALRDEDYLAVVETWQRRYQGQSPRGDQLKELAEEISGHDLDAFWQDWIYDGDKPAWPSKYDVTLTSTPDQGEVAGGTEMTFDVEAANTGKVALTDAVVEVDVSDLVDDGTLGALPEAVNRDGDTLTWAVPTLATGATTSTSFTLTVAGGPDTTRDTAFATAEAVSLGGRCVSCGPLRTTPTPTITGTARYGQKVTAVPGTWDRGVELSYQWRADGEPVDWGTDSTYVVSRFTIGARLTVAVTGTMPGYQPVTMISAPTEPVAKATPKQGTIAIVGKPKVGHVLIREVTGWGAGATTSYTWYAGKRKIGEGARLRVKKSLVDKRIRVRVKVTQPGFLTVRKFSERTAPVRG